MQAISRPQFGRSVKHRRPAHAPGAALNPWTVGLAQLPAVIWTTDCQLRLTSLQGKALASIAPAPARLLGRPLAVLLRHGHRNGLLLRAHRRACRGQPGSFEHRWDQHWFRGVVDTLLGPDGSVCGCVGLAINVTTQRQGQLQVLDEHERLRSRFSHELSEKLAQHLVSVSMQLELLQQRLAGTTPAIHADLASLSRWLRQAVEHACALAQRSYPSELERLGFLSAVDNLVRSHRLLYQIRCTLQADAAYATLDARAGIQMYRLLESAMLYVLDSGRAGRLEIRLQAGPASWILGISGNRLCSGQCDDCTSLLERRLLEQRTELLGGSLQWRRRASGGLKLICVLPRQEPTRR